MPSVHVWTVPCAWFRLWHRLVNFSPRVIVSLSRRQGYRLKSSTCKSRTGGSNGVLLTAAVKTLGHVSWRKTVRALTAHFRDTGGSWCACLWLWQRWRSRWRGVVQCGGEQAVMGRPSLVELIPFWWRWTRRRRPFFLFYLPDTYCILIQVAKSGRSHSADTRAGAVILKMLRLHTQVVLWHGTVSKRGKKMLLVASTCDAVASCTHNAGNISTIYCLGVSPAPWVVPLGKEMLWNTSIKLK